MLNKILTIIFIIGFTVLSFFNHNFIFATILSLLFFAGIMYLEQLNIELDKSLREQLDALSNRVQRLEVVKFKR